MSFPLKSPSMSAMWLTSGRDPGQIPEADEIALGPAVRTKYHFLLSWVKTSDQQFSSQWGEKRKSLFLSIGNYTTINKSS